MSQPAVARWENGAAFPDFENQRKLADIYGITIDELLGRQSPQVTADNQCAAAFNGNATTKGMTAQERDLLRIYRSASGKDQVEIMKFVYKYDTESEN